MKKVRVIFETKGVARFISHLDLNRVMQYALRKSELPIWFTEGYHQHIYLTFSNPISLGFINKYGIMEIKLVDDAFDVSQVAARLDNCLPDSIHAVESYESDRKFTEIEFSDYSISFETDDENMLEKSLRGGNLVAVKKGKAGEYEIDLAPYIKGLAIKEKNGYFEAEMRLPASLQFNINPKLVMDTAAAYAGIEIRKLRITRLRLLDKDGKIFR